MGSEMTAAAAGGRGQVRRDPMAMLPFAGYNMAQYLGHWMRMHNRIKHLPKIFHVNWFRKDEDGNFAWPGYGENMRVLKWIVDRVQGRAEAVESPFGLSPRYEDITWAGLDFSRDKYHGIMDIDRQGVMAEVQEIRQFFDTFGDRLPDELERQRKALEEKAGSAPEVWKMAG